MRGLVALIEARVRNETARETLTAIRIAVRYPVEVGAILAELDAAHKAERQQGQHRGLRRVPDDASIEGRSPVLGAPAQSGRALDAWRDTSEAKEIRQINTMICGLGRGSEDPDQVREILASLESGAADHESQPELLRSVRGGCTSSGSPTTTQPEVA